MIGNDIIDLKAARTESNWKRKGFLAKLFTVSEQSMIQHSEDPETKVWELWSRKEAAYKIYNRQTKIRAFMPLRVECSDVYENANRLYGTVTIEGMTFFTATSVTPECIKTYAVKDERSLSKIEEISTNNPKIFIFKDVNGIPYVRDLLTFAEKEISISHHGRFCSYITT